MSRTWRIAFRALYQFLRFADPLIRGWYRAYGVGNVRELRVRSRRSGRTRSVLVGILEGPDGLYLGHPDGHVEWTLDLEAAGEGELRWRDGPAIAFRPVLLEAGSERDAAIEATDQHPFPGNLVYGLARSQIREVGVYFRLDPVLEQPAS